MELRSILSPHYHCPHPDPNHCYPSPGRPVKVLLPGPIAPRLSPLHSPENNSTQFSTKQIPHHWVSYTMLAPLLFVGHISKYLCACFTALRIVLTDFLDFPERQIEVPYCGTGDETCRYLTISKEENVAFLSRRLNIPVQTCRVNVCFLPGETMRGRNRLRKLSSPVGMAPFYGSAPSIMPRMEGVCRGV